MPSSPNFGAAAPRITNVAVQLRSDMPQLLLDVMCEIKRRTGARVHGYVTTREQMRHYRALDARGVFDSLSDHNHVLRAIDEPLPPESEILAEARAFEARLGTTYNRIALTNRHLGRGYALLGPRHPRSRQFERATYAHLMHGYNQVFGFWEREIDARGIDLFLATGKEIATVSRARAIPYRGLYGSRLRNLHFWGDDEYRDSAWVRARFTELMRERHVPEIDLDEPYDLARINHARALREASAIFAAGAIARQALRHAYWRLRGYEKGRGYRLGDEAALLWRRHREWRDVAGAKAVSLEALAGKTFIFFPLQTEPETSIQQGSPEYFYQHAAIAALSRDLPAGMLIAVKETPYGIGRRPAGFYEQLRALKNVVLLDIETRGFDAVRASRAVATLVGTAGFEAAVMGKPVISFGRHNIYDCVPHVFVVRDEGEMPTLIARALDDTFSTAESRLAGRRFLQAVADCSFDLGAYSYREKSGQTADTVTACVDNLMTSLESPASAAEIGTWGRRA
ncbi:MAG: hypothetical protein ACKVSF_09510 [Alphaproteobacteria bacterium]